MRGFYRVVALLFILQISFMSSLSDSQNLLAINSEQNTSEELYSEKIDSNEKPPEVSRGYKRTREVYMTVSAYTLHPSECGKREDHPGYGRTASGYVLSDADAYQAVAVDPDVIPLGTKMIIHDRGKQYHVTAVDTGGAIEGDRMDLFVSEKNRSKAFAWGKRRCKVTILEE